MMKSIMVCFVKYRKSESQSQTSQEVEVHGHKAISELEKGDSKIEDTCRYKTHIRYIEAELLAKKRRFSIAHQ